MDRRVPADRVAAVRAFNRRYTEAIGVLGEGLLDTAYSLTEGRVLFELGQRPATEVPDLRRALAIDGGYLSRILTRFESDGLVTRERAVADGRRRVIRLTGAGRSAYQTLDARSAGEIHDLLAKLSEPDQRRLVGAMGVIRGMLAPTGRPSGYLLRPPLPGDLGWVVQRHGLRYAEDYGWDQTFEALVARIVAEYGERGDRWREQAWIAELAGEPAGCVFCTRKDDQTAQLRLLLVEPPARGAGIGGRLVDECLRFARRAGYRQVMLWTNDVLADARRLYERAGFTLVESAPHHSFGKDLVGQHWLRPLDP